MSELPSTSSAASSVRTSATQPLADRDATIAAVIAALIAPSGIAGAWLMQSVAHPDVDGDVHAGALQLAVLVAVAFPIAFAVLADRVAVRALARTQVPLKRARIVRRIALPFALVGGITELIVAIGVPFATGASARRWRASSAASLTASACASAIRAAAPSSSFRPRASIARAASAGVTPSAARGGGTWNRFTTNAPRGIFADSSRSEK